MRGWLFVLGFALLAAGCSKKRPECESLVKVVNPAMNRMSKVTASKPDQAPALIAQANEIAAIADGTARSLAAVPLTVPELAKFSADYQAMAREVAAAARATAEVVAKADVARKDAANAGAQVDLAGVKLGQGCAATKDPHDAEVCRKANERVQKRPDDPAAGIDIAKVADELESQPFKDPELVASAKALGAALRTLEKKAAAVKAVDAEWKATHATFEVAAKKEDPLVDGVNKLCL